jgi:type II secretory pathway pseudopilin PulG
LRGQKGSALLLELLIASIVMLTIAGIAMPNLVRLHFYSQTEDAKARLLVVYRANAALAICASTPGCIPSPSTAALIPAYGQQTSEGYVFDFEAGWTYVATPTNPASGQVTLSIDPSGNLMCGGSPC